MADGDERNRGRGNHGPAPELRPPGVRGALPRQQVRRMETAQETQRRVLHEQMPARVRGEIRGPGSLLNADWETMKLEEARGLEEQRQAAARAAAQQAQQVRTARSLTEQEVSYLRGLAERGRKLREEQERGRSRDRGERDRSA